MTMNEEKIIMTLHIHKTNQYVDIEVPLNISANELIYSLCKGYHLDIDLNDISQRHLKTENPIALLKGDKLISEFNLRDGSKINYTR